MEELGKVERFMSAEAKGTFEGSVDRMKDFLFSENKMSLKCCEHEK